MVKNIFQSIDEITGKWHGLSLAYTNFSDIFNNLTNVHTSGANDFDILTSVLESYEAKHKGQSFSDQKTWCRIVPKWVLQLESSSQPSGSEQS